MCALLLAALLLPGLTGCDFIRQLAGRPTSRDIAAKRALIEWEQREHQRRLDSVRLVQQAAADSLAIADSLQRSHQIRTSTQLGGLAAARLDKRYYVVLGSFGVRANAEKLSRKLQEAGHEPVLIAYRNGFTVVAACPSGSLRAASDSLRALRRHPFCPADAWILSNE